MSEFYREYRPKTLKGIIGQQEAVSTVQRFLDKGTVPHCLMLTGPSGVGKTTIARILRNELQCGDADFQELNCADFRGIDDVRNVRRNMQLSPIAGKCRIWLIDECFPSGTLVSTVDGCVPIEKVTVGSYVDCLDSIARVSNVFKNKIPLNRVCRVNFVDGSFIITTLQHRFLTDGQTWIEASYLKNACVLRKPCQFVLHDTDMSFLQKRICFKVAQQSKMLLQKLCAAIEKQKIRIRSFRDSCLSVLQKPFLCQVFTQEDLLFHVLCQKMVCESARLCASVIQPNCERTAQKSDHTIPSFTSWKTLGKTIVHSDDLQKSFSRSCDCRKNHCNKTKKWNSSYLERKKGREWKFYGFTVTALEIIRKTLGTGVGNINRVFKQAKDWISYQLQSRYRPIRFETGNRSGWICSSNESDYAKRQEEDGGPESIRVESVEIYQRGYNDESFRGVISDRDRCRGYVEFYDLEVDGPSHSYFANSFCVHNCHRLTGDAQQAMLKMLEDTPDHVYFFLCTTDPQKLIKTIRTRATEIKLVALKTNELQKIIQRVVDREALKVPTSVIEEITEASDFSARKALVLLGQVADLDSEDEQLAAIVNSNFNKEDAFRLAQLVFNFRRDASWPAIAKVLRDLSEQDPEGIRYCMLGYARSVLVGKDDKAPNAKFAEKAFGIIEIFGRNFYDSKHAGLAGACWEAFTRLK